MATHKPAFVFKDMNLFVNARTLLGQVSELTLPVPEVKVEAIRNAGMVKPREVHVGYELLESGFKSSSLDPVVVKEFGIAPGRSLPLIGYAYLQDEDGAEHEARAEMHTFCKKVDIGTWQTGEKSETEYMFAVNEYELYMDDERIIAMTDFEVLVGGVSATPGRAAALRIG